MISSTSGSTYRPSLLLQQYYEIRSRQIQKLRQTLKPNPYPHKFHVTKSIPQFIRDYGGEDKNGNEVVSKGARHADIVSLAGRVHNIRESSAKLRFYDLHGEGLKVQIMASAQCVFWFD